MYKYLILSILFVISCESNTPNDLDELNVRAEKAWFEFENENYTVSLNLFKDILDVDSSNYEGINGLSWSYLLLGKNDLCISYLNSIKVLDMNLKTILLISLYQKGLYEHAVNMSTYDFSSWTFEHNLNLKSIDIHIVLAQCYFMLETYDKCIEEIKEIDPNFSLLQTNENFIELLSKKLEEYNFSLE